MRVPLIFALLLTAFMGLARASEAGTYLQPFAANSPWNIIPVGPQLGTVGVPADVNFPAIGEGTYSTGVFQAQASDGPMTVYPGVGQTGVWDPDSSLYLPSVTIPHWPADTVGATGGDGHCDIIDATTNTVHSFWILKKDSAGTWRAQQWAWSPLNGAGWGDPAHYYQGARAAGVPTCGGIIRKHEYHDSDTMYRHALAMSLSLTGLASSPAYVFPATSADSDAATTNLGGVPEGALLMLPATFPVETLSNIELKKIARTLMIYGARVVDRNQGTPYSIYVENGSGWVGMGATWNNAYASDLQTIRSGLRMVESASGWADRSGAAITVDASGAGMPLLSLRGSWTLQAGSVVGSYDTLSQSLRWGATGATASRQVNFNGIGYNRMTWGRLVAGGVYRFEVQATGGAKLKLEIHDGSTFALQYTTAYLGNGEGVTFTCPASTYVVPVATSGVNVASSAVACTLTSGTVISVAPAIATQPRDALVSLGAAATFTVAVTGTPAPACQWRRDGVDIPGATTTGYTTAATVAGDAGARFSVRVSSSAGSVESRTATLALAGGWQASYHDQVDFSGALLQRIDPTLDFAWGSASPATGIAAHTFSVRWRGWLQLPSSGLWTFTATSDSLVRVWADGQQIINHWTNSGSVTVSGQIALPTDRLVEVVMEYAAGNGAAAARLTWTAPGGIAQVIPTTSLAPGDAGELPGAWTRHALGSSAAGAVAVSSVDGTWTVTDAGGDLWGTADQGTLVCQVLSGDMSITAQVQGVISDDPWAKAGLMLRATSATDATDAAYAATCLSRDQGIAFLRRQEFGGVTSYTAGPTAGAPAWVRVERRGTALIGLCSVDGSTWREVRRVSIDISGALQIGLVVSAHGGAPCTASFSHVSIISAAAAAN